MRSLALFLIAVLLHGCASAQPGQGLTSDQSPLLTEPSINTITGKAIADANVFTAYQVIERLRPAWLRSRGPKIVGAPAAPVYATVYIDDHRSGDLGQLREISTRDIAEIRFLSPSEATVTYGGGALGGVILITTQSRRGIPPET